MIERKRTFLSQIFEREWRTMLRHLQGKKKYKKTHQKLGSLNKVKLEIILDDYFWGVCYAFYKR